MEYYISVNNNKRGPYSIEELRARGISSETLVMADGTDQWVPAWQVEELRPVIAQAQANTETQTATEQTNESAAPVIEDVVDAEPVAGSWSDYSQPGEQHGQENFQTGQPIGGQPVAEKKKSGGCLRAFLIALIALAVVVGLAVLTCPKEQDHKDALTTVVSSAISEEEDSTAKTMQGDDTVSKLYRQMSDSWTKEVVKRAVDNLIHVDNHIVFSVGKVRLAGKTHNVSVGVFGHVFTVDKETLRKAADEYYQKAEDQVIQDLKKQASKMINETVVDPAMDVVEEVASQIEEEMKKAFGDMMPFGGESEEPTDSTDSSEGI